MKTTPEDLAARGAAALAEANRDDEARLAGGVVADLFPNAPTQVSLKDQIAELGRELAMRRRVYPRWVADKKMTQATADRQIAAMDAALATLANQARETKARPGPDLAALKSRIDARLNNRLVDMREGWDDSVCGFNEAWDLMREVFADAAKEQA